MEILPIEVFGLHADVAFPQPVGYRAAKLEEFGSALCNPQTGISVRAEQIRLRCFDELFDYELKANFFGDNGTLMRNAERVKLGVRNARTKGDWNVIHQTFTRFYTLMNFDPKSLTHLSAHVHARFDSLDERDAWLREGSRYDFVDKPALLGYVKIADWEKDIRVLIEPSNMVPNAIFCAWDTQFVNHQEWDTFLGAMPSVMENSINFFEMGFEPFKERV